MATATIQQDQHEDLAFDDVLYEVVGGQPVEIEPIGAFESALASRLNSRLDIFGEQNKLGLAVTETLFVLDSQRDLKRRPDVAFVSYTRWPEAVVPQTEAWDVVPDLAVEIISPTNYAQKVDDKIVEYIEGGVRLVWVIYSDSRRVYVYRSTTRAEILQRSDELDGADVLPGFRLPIQSLFDAVTKPVG